MPDVGWLDVANVGARRQTILRQADAAVAQIGADLLVLHAIEAQLVERLSRACASARRRHRPRRGSSTSNMVCTVPAISGEVRQAAAKYSSSARRDSGSRRMSVFSSAGTDWV